jgi:predicted transcriptional regulator
MEITTLKEHIADLLTTVEDERFLKSISAMLQTYLSSSALSVEERAAVDEGIKDVEGGRVVDHQQVRLNTQSRYPRLQPSVWK